MRAPPRSLIAVLVAGLLAAAAPAAASAQERTILSNRISVSSDDAVLDLQFSDGGELSVGLTGGRVVVDGEEVGTYERGGALDTAWRDLLGDVVTLDDGPLGRALREWTPPAELPEGAARIAGRIDRSLETALAAPETRSPPADAAPDRGQGDDLTRLLRRTSRLPGLAEALEGLELRGVQLRVGEDVEVGEGERIEGTLIVVDGDLTVRGAVAGDVVVTGGTLRLTDGARIAGEARLVDAELDNRGGRVGGAVRTLPTAPSGLGPPDRDELEDRIRREVRAELGDARARSRPGRGAPRSAVSHWISHVFGAISGMVRTLVTFLVLSLIGLGVVRFAPDNLHAVSEAARRNPGRSAAVGAAGLVLLLPVWVLGVVALAISIVGLVGLPFWIVLFPVAAALAAGLGYLAVARNLGEWVVEQRLRWLEGLDLRASNTIHTLVTGLAVLLSLYFVGHAMELFGGILGFVEALLMGTAAVATLVVTVIGFGAVILTRGGRRPDWDGDEPFGPIWPTDPTPEPAPGGAPGAAGPTEPGFGHTGTRDPDEGPREARPGPEGSE